MTEAGKIDEKGAFIQTPMKGPPVASGLYALCSRIDKADCDPEFKKFVNEKGFYFVDC